MTAITATLQPSSASVLLAVTGAPAGAVIIVRTDANGSNLVRLREGQSPIAGAMTATDYEPALVGLVSYSCTDSAGATVTASTDFAGSVSAPQLTNVQLPQLSASLEYVTGYSAARESSSTVHDIIGRADPVAVLGVARLRRGRLETRHSDHESALAASAALAAGVVMLRQVTHTGMDMYLLGSRIGVDPIDRAQDGWRFQGSCDYVELRSPALPLLGNAGWSYADLTAAHTSYAAVRDAFADYSEVVVGP